jgi:hypothetical protein
MFCSSLNYPVLYHTSLWRADAACQAKGLGYMSKVAWHEWDIDTSMSVVPYVPHMCHALDQNATQHFPPTSNNKLCTINTLNCYLHK